VHGRVRCRRMSPRTPRAEELAFAVAPFGYSGERERVLGKALGISVFHDD
jgi:hypothetical protein